MKMLSVAILVGGALLAPIAGKAQIQYEPYTFTTFAGMPGGRGNIDGTGNAARFFDPIGAAVDSAGNIYIADSANCTIRKITPAGVVTTVAGSPGNCGSVDGTGSAAQFSNAGGIAVDSAGNVYVADTGNSTIRKITPAGVVTTLAGSAGNYGSSDGIGSAAMFNGPNDVGVDSAGNVYVADTYNNTIRKVTAAGVVTTVAGLAGSAGTADGTGNAARFVSPIGIAIDATDNIYVTDFAAETIRKITSGGVVTTFAGSAGQAGSADGTGSGARFKNPRAVAADSAGNLYVADEGNQTIRKITSGGVVTTLAGSVGNIGSANGTGSAAQFYDPEGVAVDSNGNVYVADNQNDTIRKITSGGAVTTFAGYPAHSGSADGTGSAARFNGPDSVAVDSANNVYVADSRNDTIRKITPAGAVITLAGSAGTAGSADGTGAAAQFYFPQGVAADSAANVYVADTRNQTIRKITAGATVTTLAGSVGSAGSSDGTGAAALFHNPLGVATDSGGNIYVADAVNSTIRKITPGGTVTTFAGSAGNPGSADGTGPAAQFNAPLGVAVDGNGNVYVADAANYTIRKITPAGAVTTLAGSAGNAGSADGTGSAARFGEVEDVAVDSAGNVYVADTDNNTIRKITPGGAVTTLGGSPATQGSVDGTGSAAHFNSPHGIALDGNGNVYVADIVENVIRIGQAVATPTATPTATATANPSATATPTATPTPTGSPSSVVTPTGANVVVQGDGISATFSAVSTAGETSFTTIAPQSAGPLPSGYVLSGGSVAVDITTTASYTPPVEVCFTITGVDNPANFAQLRVLHGEGGVLVDRTISSDFASRTICAQVNSLSPFVIARALPTVLANISTRLAVQQHDNVLIGGFIVTGTEPKRVLIRALGPSLPVSDGLANPVLELYSGQTLLQTNDNWVDSPDKQAIIDTTIPPSSEFESAMVVTLPANSARYTAVVHGLDGGVGIGQVEIYDLDNKVDSKLANISTRGLVQTKDNVMIGGFIVLNGTEKVIVRAIGPSLPVEGALQDPLLELHDSNGNVTTNDNWRTGGQEQEIIATTVPPSSEAESAIVATLPAGNYTAVVRGVSNATGVALVEVFALN